MVRFVENPEEKANADGVCGHLEAIGETNFKRSAYDRIWKRLIDIILSFGGLVALSPVFLILSIAIIIDDSGPVLFTQKRLGRNKQYFKLHKFRSMKMSTPHDRPTHMLENSEQYITKVGAGGIIETTALNPYRIRTFEIDKMDLYSEINGFRYLVAGRAVRLVFFYAFE